MMMHKCQPYHVISHLRRWWIGTKITHCDMPNPSPICVLTAPFLQHLILNSIYEGEIEINSSPINFNDLFLVFFYRGNPHAMAVEWKMIILCDESYLRTGSSISNYVATLFLSSWVIKRVKIAAIKWQNAAVAVKLEYFHFYMWR